MSLNKYKVTDTKEIKEAEELINYYDDDYERIGTTTRKEGIDKNLLLEAVQVWIINPKNKQVLMQRRSEDKENDSNMIDVSASGHVKSNETPLQAILRESKEEIGIEPEELMKTLKEVAIVELDLSKFGRKGNYFTHEYVAFVEKPISYYKKQDEEVKKLFFMKYEEVKEKIRNKDKSMRIPKIRQTEELLYKIDENLYNLSKRKKGELECEER